MNAVKINKKDALLLTAAGLGMAMSQKAEEGQKIVQATLKNYVLPQRRYWAFYGLQLTISKALEELACGRIEGYIYRLEEAQEDCLAELEKEKKPKLFFQGEEYRMLDLEEGGNPEEGCFLWNERSCVGFYFKGVLDHTLSVWDE